MRVLEISNNVPARPLPWTQAKSRIDQPRGLYGVAGKEGVRWAPESHEEARRVVSLITSKTDSDAGACSLTHPQCRAEICLNLMDASRARCETAGSCAPIGYYSVWRRVAANANERVTRAKGLAASPAYRRVD